MDLILEVGEEEEIGNNPVPMEVSMIFREIRQVNNRNLAVFESEYLKRLPNSKGMEVTYEYNELFKTFLEMYAFDNDNLAEVAKGLRSLLWAERMKNSIWV